ncbi:MAG TPA: FecR domain-containing protein [Gemmatimonadaceae bacterium]|nr:FecR domain-containing protein [Gemmatimonadaceae bacterium]
MRPLSDADWVRLVRYFAGELTPAENQELERWDEDQPGWNRTLGVLRQAWRARPAKQFAGDSQALWITLQQAIGTAGGAVAPRQQSARPAVKGIRVLGTQPLRRRTWYVLAVASIVMVVGGIAMNTPQLLWRASSTPTYTVYATANGQRATITLPDDNIVSLNVGSRLEVPTNYGAGNHVVRLPVGEALFDVSHRAGTPFTVVSDPATVQVLGTRFLVRHFRTDTAMAVGVEQGRVSTGGTVLSAHQWVELNKGGVSPVEVADPSQFSFVAGVLTIRHRTLAAAIPDLNRWYDAEIKLGDAALANEEFEGKFPAGSLSDLTTVLELTFNVRVVRTGRVLTLYAGSKS